jgi:hypothetical protein
MLNETNNSSDYREAEECSVEGMLCTSRIIIKTDISRHPMEWVTWMPYHSQSIPFRDIAEASPTEQDTETTVWRAMKLTELNIVSVTVSFPEISKMHYYLFSTSNVLAESLPFREH